MQSTKEYLRFLHTHHTIEDNFIFPFLSSKMNVSHLSQDHTKLTLLMDKVHKFIDDFYNNMNNLSTSSTNSSSSFSSSTSSSSSSSNSPSTSVLDNNSDTSLSWFDRESFLQDLKTLKDFIFPHMQLEEDLTTPDKMRSLFTPDEMKSLLG